MISQILTTARRAAFGGAAGLTGFAAYKSKTDPIHIFWDLDHTILCSISPMPSDTDGQNNDSGTKQQTSKCPVSPSNLASSLPSSPPLRHFDQIDDDFPYDSHTLSPNTRTYFRPGAQAALRLCNIFGILHVYTAAQETYTTNILNELDREKALFNKILHRDDHPQIVKEGKCLSIGTEDMKRAILFDDKISNFRPQNYENGVAVMPFTSNAVRKCNSGSWNTYLSEVKEMSRLVAIAFFSSVHFSGDVRRVVGWVHVRDDAKQ